MFRLPFSLSDSLLALSVTEPRADDDDDDKEEEEDDDDADATSRFGPGIINRSLFLLPFKSASSRDATPTPNWQLDRRGYFGQPALPCRQILVSNKAPKSQLTT